MDTLKSELCRLVPFKIDIGAVYNIKPKDRKTIRADAFIPLERELVFDIDMTDYDDIRTCCSGANICLVCWDFMTCAIQVIHRCLTEDFGFKNILWVYSGRRGVHCWVCDESARHLSVESRKAIVGYLELVKGGEKQEKKVSLKKIHPSLDKAYEICREYFGTTLVGKMKILQQSREQLSKLLPDEKSLKYLETQFNGKQVPKDEILRDPNPIKEVVFQYTYPRLDTNVSIGLNHLLKAPFCVHPKTGRICVPIDPKNCRLFDPFKVPVLNDLIHELDEPKQQLLQPYIQIFDDFLHGLSVSIKEKMRMQRQESLQF